jgi:hypothetical protein
MPVECALPVGPSPPELVTAITTAMTAAEAATIAAITEITVSHAILRWSAVAVSAISRIWSTP